MNYPLLALTIGTALFCAGIAIGLLVGYITWATWTNVGTGKADNQCRTYVNDEVGHGRE